MPEARNNVAQGDTVFLPALGREIKEGREPQRGGTPYYYELVLEVKGQDNQEQQTKREFLGEWVRAVTGHHGFGIWSADVSRNPTDIHEILARHDN